MSDWPLVGRVDELARLQQAVQRGSGVVLVGAAGVGKTRLLTELAAYEESAGRRTARITATHSSQAIPLGAVADWIPAARPGGDPDPVAVLANAFDAFSGTNRDTPLLAVDDAHLLDQLTATLLHRLALNRSVTLVLTVRDAETPPAAITSLWKDDLLERLEVTRLDSGAVGQLLRRRLGGEVETRTSRQLAELAAGNVLFLRELVEGELRRGNLREQDGLWHWRPPARLGQSVLEVIETRLHDLPPESMAVCQLLAMREPLPLEVLVELTTPEAVGAAEQCGAVSVINDGVGQYEGRFSHPLYGEALRDRIPTALAVRLRTRLLHALGEPVPSDDVAVLRRAVLLLESDTTARADQLLPGAVVASSLFDYQLAEQLGRAALAAGGGFPALLTTAYAMTRAGHPDMGGVLTELVEAAVTDEEISAAVALQVSAMFWVQSRLPDARAHLAAARAQVSEPARFALDALHACFEFFDGRPSSATEVATSVAEAPEADPFAVAWASAAAAIADAVRGRTGQALQHVRRGEASAAQLHNERFVHLPLGNGEMLALGLSGRISEAQDRADALQSLARTAPIGDTSAIADFFAGQAALWSGDIETAVRRLREALLRLAANDPGEWSDQCRIWLAQALAMSGQPGAAEECLAHMVGDFEVFTPLRELSAAWVDAGYGNLDTAIRAAHRAAASARRQEQSAVEVLALHSATRWGDSSGAQRLTELAATVGGPRAALAARHSAALAGGDAFLLHEVAQGWAEIGALALGADTVAQAAAAHRRHGDAARASGAVHHARTMSRHTGSRTPALTALAAATPLTGQELQIATLAAHGSTNAEIAARLVISTRTVEGHLYRAYAKLGIHRRNALPEALGLIPAVDSEPGTRPLDNGVTRAETSP